MYKRTGCSVLLLICHDNKKKNTNTNKTQQLKAVWRGKLDGHAARLMRLRLRCVFGCRQSTGHKLDRQKPSIVSTYGRLDRFLVFRRQGKDARWRCHVGQLLLLALFAWWVSRRIGRSVKQSAESLLAVLLFIIIIVLFPISFLFCLFNQEIKEIRGKKTWKEIGKGNWFIEEGKYLP